MKTSSLLMLGCLLVVSGCVGAEKRIWTKAFLNKQAPNLIVEKWLTKEPDRTGKFVLIDFVSTSDDTDRAVRGDIIRTLNSLHKELEERLVIISVSDETEDRVRSKKEPPIEYSSAIDTKKRTATALGVDDMPSVLIIDPQGIVRWQGFWLLDGTDAAIEAARKLLEQVPGL